MLLLYSEFWFHRAEPPLFYFDHVDGMENVTLI